MKKRINKVALLNEAEHFAKWKSINKKELWKHWKAIKKEFGMETTFFEYCLFHFKSKKKHFCNKEKKRDFSTNAKLLIKGTVITISLLLLTTVLNGQCRNKTLRQCVNENAEGVAIGASFIFGYISAEADMALPYYLGAAVSHGGLRYENTKLKSIMKLGFDPRMLVDSIALDGKVSFTVPTGKFEIGTSMEKYRLIKYHSYSFIVDYKWLDMERRTKKKRLKSFKVLSGGGPVFIYNQNIKIVSFEINTELRYWFRWWFIGWQCNGVYRWELSNKPFKYSNYIFIGTKF